MTLDGRGRFRTERAARRRMRCSHRNHQASFCDLDLINEHALGKWKQWCSFHDTLALRDETILKRFLMKGTIPLHAHLPLQATEQSAPNPAMSRLMLGFTFLETQKEQDRRSFVLPSVLHCCLSSTDALHMNEWRGA